MTPQDFLRIAADNKDRPFLIIPDRRQTLSFGEFHDAALGLACRLQDEGVRRGDRVVALLTNCPEYAVLYFACLYLGATVVTANPSLHLRDVHFVLSHAGAKLVVYGEETKHFLLGPSAPPDSTRRWLMPKLHEPLFRVAWSAHPWKPLDGATPADLLTIVFTSGTTAFPKAVAHRTTSLLGNAAAFNAAMGIGPSDRFLHLLPMSYSGGFFNALIAPYAAGASVVLTPGFGPRTALDFWKAPMEHGVNALWLTPAILSALLKVDRDEAGKAWCRKSVKKVFVGMGPLHLQVKRDFEKAYGVEVLESFGLSETLLLAANAPGKSVEGSVGRVLPGVELKTDAEGELLARTPHLMAGYLDQESSRVVPPEGEWFPTGDAGTVGADGLVRITGRKKDLIIRGGLNISPMAVEDVLLRHDAVAAVAVIGVPNAVTGEDVAAVVKLKPGRDWAVERPSLEAFCKSEIAAASRPAVLLCREELPVGPTGKVLKRELRDWAATQAAAR
ncbi:MAG: class I adenylate-forming enzyme family protein [Elusimicrobiota bacterium]|nr:class I adenylate-forming enzyme family protein [Elusimicrobiota bacterium]